jgi:hypothetical protein
MFSPIGNKTLATGTELCTHQMRPVCSEFVAANTTNCYQLAAAAGINLQQFLDFNKNVHDNCDNVLVGKKVRIP